MHGSGTIKERLDNFMFEISANSFFQTNPGQAAKLYALIVQWAELRGDEIVYDLYCGTGSISIFVAPHVKKVYGYELVADAIEDARKNCALNEVHNCKFSVGDVRKTFAKCARDGGAQKPDVVILDPPRAGLSSETLRGVLELLPEKVIYVSCNPATLARDLHELCESSFTLSRVLPVDMFPHTWHVEVLTLLVRK